MMESDVEKFLDLVHSTGNIVLIQDQRYSTSKPNINEEWLIPSVDNNLELTLFYFWNKDFQERPLIHKVEPYDKSIPDFYSLDFMNSPVIEFSRCILKNGILMEGRIWAEMQILTEVDGIISKSQHFISWYEQIAKWIKKNFKKEKDKWSGNVYIGFEAGEWWKKDGSFENIEQEK
jgi:hypothetical protein